MTLKLCNQTVLYNDIEGDFVSLPFEIAITDASRVAFKSIARCYFSSLACVCFLFLQHVSSAALGSSKNAISVVFERWLLFHFYAVTLRFQCS